MFCLLINLGSPPLGLAVKSSGSNFPQALGSVLLLSFVHLPIVLSDPVLAYPGPGRYVRLSRSRVQIWPANTLFRFQCGVVLVISKV